MVLIINVQLPFSEMPLEFDTVASTCMVLYPKSAVDYHWLARLHITKVDVVEPRSVVDALSSPDWKYTMEDELMALPANNTWSLVRLPPNASIVRCRWVFKVK